MHTVVLILAAAAVLGLLVVVSVAVANVAASMVDDGVSEREAHQRTALVVAWDGVERRTGVDRRWRTQGELGGAVGRRDAERRVGGRRLTDLPAGLSHAA